jgi:hypothetical protein
MPQFTDSRQVATFRGIHSGKEGDEDWEATVALYAAITRQAPLYHSKQMKGTR